MKKIKIGLIAKLNDFGQDIVIYGPWADKDEVQREYNLNINSGLPYDKFDDIILAVAHQKFKNIDIEKLNKDDDSIVYDVKGFLDNSTHRL